MKYQWIEIAEATKALGQNLIFFGAGKGCQEMLAFIRESKRQAGVRFIVDNDRSLHGKTLLGYAIYSPEVLEQARDNLIVVTSVSGREAIAEQLGCMGMTEGKDFIQVGRYPESNCFDNFMLIKDCIQGINGHALTIGPGGFLGLETLLAAAGCETVTSIDINTFGITYPEVTERKAGYDRVRQFLTNHDRFRDDKEMVQRFNRLFHLQQDRVFLDQTKIIHEYPMDLCALSFPNESFDRVFSFAVLEHVREADRAVAQLSRVLKQGGLCLHKIVTADHRSFSAIKGFTPFSFREYTHEEWEALVRNKFYQNRLLPVEWKRLFGQHGLEILSYKIEKRIPLNEKILSTFSRDFSCFFTQELEEVNCTISAKKV